VYLNREGIFGSSSRRTRHKFTRHESDVFRWLEVPRSSGEVTVEFTKTMDLCMCDFGTEGKSS
jgi:hypothetical protein